jgi:CNT family concentrative nucleoside transporter
MTAHSLEELKAHGVEQSGAGRFMGLVGCCAMIGVAFLASTNRRRVDWKLVAIGSVMQVVFALLVLKTGAGRALFVAANDAVTNLLNYSDVGARFVFGNLVDNNVPIGVPVAEPKNLVPLATKELWAAVGSMIAFRVLPTILFFSALTAVLYHVGALTLVVRGLARLMQKTMGTSGAESLSAAMNIFVGQTEAPLLVRPFIQRMTESELMCVMTGGFANVAGGVMAAYVGMLSGVFPDIAGHLLAASVMSAPASLVMSKIMVPETGDPVTRGDHPIAIEKIDANVIDAASRGTTEGLTLALNVGAMLIAFVALIALVNAAIGGLGALVGHPEVTLQYVFGLAGAPLAWVLGTPWDDAIAVGRLIGIKTVVNEFVAYAELAKLLDAGALHHGKSAIIATYALCGFANFGSVGIQIGGLAALAPERRSDVARLGLRAMLAGSLSSFQVAAIAAIVL